MLRRVRAQNRVIEVVLINHPDFNLYSVSRRPRPIDYPGLHTQRLIHVNFRLTNGQECYALHYAN